jgi:hypothetical protein
VASSSPAWSIGSRRPRLSASSRGASSATTTPTGTLTQKIQCHDSALVSSPPAIGPSATPSPEIAAQVPSAAVRRSGGKAVESSVSVSGITTAEPTPWATRAPTRTAGEPGRFEEHRTVSFAMCRTERLY